MGSVAVFFILCSLYQNVFTTSFSGISFYEDGNCWSCQPCILQMKQGVQNEGTFVRYNNTRWRQTKSKKQRFAFWSEGGLMCLRLNEQHSDSCKTKGGSRYDITFLNIFITISTCCAIFLYIGLRMKTPKSSWGTRGCSFVNDSYTDSETNIAGCTKIPYRDSFIMEEDKAVDDNSDLNQSKPDQERGSVLPSTDLILDSTDQENLANVLSNGLTQHDTNCSVHFLTHEEAGPSDDRCVPMFPTPMIVTCDLTVSENQDHNYPIDFASHAEATVPNQPETQSVYHLPDSGTITPEVMSMDTYLQAIRDIKTGVVVDEMVRNFKNVAKRIAKEKHPGKDNTKLVRTHANKFKETARFGMYLHRNSLCKHTSSTVWLEQQIHSYHKDMFLTAIK